MSDVNHPDEAQDQEMIAPLVQAVEYLIQKVETLESQVKDLSSVVMDDLIGGMHSIYSENKKKDAIASLKGRHGARLGPHFDMLKEFTPGVDHWNELSQLTDGKSDDEVQGMIDQLDSILSDKFGKIRNGGGTPASAKITSVEATPLKAIPLKVDAEGGPDEEKEPQDEAVRIASRLSDKAVNGRR